MTVTGAQHLDENGEAMPHPTQTPGARGQSGRRVRGRYLLLVTAAVAVAALVAACGGGASGSGGSTSSTSPSSAGSSAAGSGTGSGAGFGGGPAASGVIAAVQPGNIEVQSSTAGQLTVDFTSTTRITQTVAASLADITVGSCIVAIDAVTTGSSASTSTAASPTTITVDPAVNGSCTRTGGGGGFGGTRPSGFPTDRPSGSRSFPTNRPSGSGFSRGNFASAITSGKVTAVSGATITVAAVNFARPSASASVSASPTTTTKTITVGSSTKITKTAAVTSAALKVGLCASAQGSTDTSGTVAATSIALTSPDSNGSCETTGFGGRFGGFGGGSGAGVTGSGAGATSANG